MIPQPEYRNAVQIGLHAFAEMLYLTEDNFWQKLPEIAQVNRIILPRQYKHIRYNYYGIDEQPYVIANMQQQHQHVERAKWMCINIGTSTQICRQDGFFGSGPQNYVGRFTLDDTLQFVCEESAINSIDLLKIDIEGDEIPVMQNYSFKIKPRLIFIEVHTDDKKVITPTPPKNS